MRIERERSDYRSARPQSSSAGGDPLAPTGTTTTSAESSSSSEPVTKREPNEEDNQLSLNSGEDKEQSIKPNASTPSSQSESASAFKKKKRLGVLLSSILFSFVQ